MQVTDKKKVEGAGLTIDPIAVQQQNAQFMQPTMSENPTPTPPALDLAAIQQQNATMFNPTMSKGVAGEGVVDSQNIIGTIQGGEGFNAIRTGSTGPYLDQKPISQAAATGLHTQWDALPENVAESKRQAALAAKGLPATVQVHDTGGAAKVVDVIDVPESGVMPAHRFASTGVTVAGGKSVNDFMADTAKTSAIYGQKRQEPIFETIKGKQVLVGQRDVADTAKIAESLATEEANRLRAESDQAKLELDKTQLAESKRHNKASEGISWYSAKKSGSSENALTKNLDALVKTGVAKDAKEAFEMLNGKKGGREDFVTSVVSQGMTAARQNFETPDINKLVTDANTAADTLYGRRVQQPAQAAPVKPKANRPPLAMFGGVK